MIRNLITRIPKLTLPVVMGGVQSYLQRALSVQPTKIIQALNMVNPSGNLITDESGAGNHGDMFAVGVYEDQTGITLTAKGGPVSALNSIAFSGDNTGIDLAHVEGNTFGADWNGNLYSAIAWMKVDGAARWTDATTFRYGWHIRDGFDTTYYTVMGKHTDNHKIIWRRRTGGAITEQSYTYDPSGPTDWFCMGIGFDLTGGAGNGPLLDFYLWDSVSGFQKMTGSESANLTDWGNHPPTEGTTLFGAGSLTLQEWIGSHSLCITWSGVKLSDAEIEQAMTP